MVAMSVGACLGGDEPVESRLQKAEIRSVRSERVYEARAGSRRDGFVQAVLQASTDSAAWTVPGQLSRFQTREQISKS
jgi:hypothetical protein